MIIIYDFETTSVCPNTCDVVQLSAVPIDNVTLEIIENDIFNTYVRPDSFDTITENDENTLWHANNKRIKPSELLNLWKDQPKISSVWPDFVNYVNKYNKGKSKFTAPVRAGHNIIKFDDIIAQRLHTLYGKNKPLFHPRDCIDLLHWFYAWFEDNSDLENKYNMDHVRRYLGLSLEGAHDSKKDVLDCARIVVRFMNLIRRTAKNIEFKGAFANAGM